MRRGLSAALLVASTLASASAAWAGGTNLAVSAGSSPATLKLSLEQALRLGLERSLALRSAAVTLEQGRALVSLSRSPFLPKLDLVGLGTYAQVGTNVNFISNLSFLGDLNLNLGSNGYAVVRNSFGNLGLALTYQLIDFRRGPLREAAKAGFAASQSAELEQQRLSRFAITAAYLNLQLADALIPVWQRSLAVSTTLQRDVAAIRARGLASRLESFQAEALVQKDRQGLVEAEAQDQIARSALARLLDLPADQLVAASDPLRPGAAWGLDLPTTVRRSLLDRPSLTALEQQRQAQLAQVRLARAALLPSVGVVLGGGINANRIDLPVATSTPTAGIGTGSSLTLPQQNLSASQSGTFYDWGALLALRQPLFDGGSSQASAAVAQRQAEQQQIAIETAQQAITQSVQTWWYTHRAASQQITAAEAAATAGERAVRDAQLRYRAGIGPILDVLSTQRDLQVARSSLALAIHRWNLSHAGMEMETGSDGNGVSASPPGHSGAITPMAVATPEVAPGTATPAATRAP
jgi:outer membrane protein